MTEAPIVFVLPGSIDTPTGGYRYDRRLIRELRALGHAVEVIELTGGFPHPTSDDVETALDRLRAARRDATLIVDGLAYSATGALAEGIHRLARPTVALIHHPLAREAGLSPDARTRLDHAERQALALADAVVVTSPETRQILHADFGLPIERIAVALPGFERPATRSITAAGTSPIGARHLLTVAALVPRKRYLDLIAAYARIADLDWQATIVGSPAFDPGHAGAIRAAIDAAGLTPRVTLVGAIDEEALSAHYAAADLFVLPTEYEGYGMAFGEAMMHGLGIIGTTGARAAIGDGGDMIEPGDVAGLAALLRRGIVEADELERLRRMADARAAQLPMWVEAARVVSGLIASARA